jgi:hypothetical protein
VAERASSCSGAAHNSHTEKISSLSFSAVTKTDVSFHAKRFHFCIRDLEIPSLFISAPDHGDSVRLAFGL